MSTQELLNFYFIRAQDNIGAINFVPMKIINLITYSINVVLQEILGSKSKHYFKLIKQKST